jgi:hypothetical protein
VALNALRFRIGLSRVRWLASLAKGAAAAPADLLVRFDLRRAGLLDSRDRPTERAHTLAPEAARNLSLWVAALARRPDAIPPGASFGIDPVEAVLPPDLIAELKGQP